MNDGKSDPEKNGDFTKNQRKAAGLISNDVLRWFIGDLTKDEQKGMIYRRAIESKAFGKILIFSVGEQSQIVSFMNAVADSFKEKEKHKS